MRSSFRITAARPLALLLAAACAGSDGAAGDADSALVRDLALAAAPAARPATGGGDLPPIATLGDTALGDTALRAAPAPAAPPRPTDRAPAPRPAPASVAEEPAPAPEPAAEPVGDAPAEAAPAASAAARGARTVGAGTGFAVTTQSAVCSGQHRPGDKFVARVSGDVAGPDGVAIPEGALVVLELAEAAPGAEGAAAMRFRVRSVSVRDSSYAVAAEVTARGEIERTKQVTGGGNAGGRAVRGAIVGAILGQVLGGDARATVTGAAAGAAVGAATGAGRVTYEGCFPAGGTLDVRLLAPVAIAEP